MPKPFGKLAGAACATALAFAFGLQGTAATAQDSAPGASVELSHTTDAPVTPDAPEKASPAMWQVTDEDTTIYLFGTVHTLPKDAGWYDGAVKTALDSADTLVTEIDMNPESMAAVAPMILSKGTLPQGQTLRGLMTDDQRTRYETGLTGLGIPVAAFDQVEPWLAAIGLTQVLVQQAGFSGDTGADKVLSETIAPEVKREALETAEYQLSVFDELPVDDQIAFLLQGLESPEEALAMLNKMVAEWREGDVEELASMLQASAAASPAMTERLFHVRNANWADWIANRMAMPGTVFMAVGAGHLAGEKSVQDYLQQRGIAATRVQ